MPIVEPEVNIKSAERGASDELLLAAILEQLDGIPDGQQVMLKLSVPVRPGLFDPLVEHPKVLRVVALSGGFSRAEACRELAKNPGVIASFSRALLSDLRHGQSDAEFDRTLGTAIDEIYRASVESSLSMTKPREAAVDEYIADRLLGESALAALQTNAAAERHRRSDVSAAPGQAAPSTRAHGQARHILEVSTLGGYSTIWLAPRAAASSMAGW